MDKNTTNIILRFMIGLFIMFVLMLVMLFVIIIKINFIT